MVSAILNNVLENKNSIRLAKPNRHLVFKFGQGNLNISGSTMDFLMYLSPFVDLEGKIIIPLEQAKYELHMQSSTFERVIRESLYQQLIYKRGNEYYSLFHIHTDGSDNRFDYIKLIHAYTSPTVQSYSLRYKRLFYYFISNTRMGNWQRFYIENLYNNKVRKENVGVDYFESFQEISEALLKLVQDGLIEIKLPDLHTNNQSYQRTNSQGTILNVNTPSLSDEYYSYFNTTIGHKKIRTSVNRSKRHVIQVRITNAIATNDLNVSASELEFILFAEAKSIAWNEIEQKSLNQIISYKNELFRLAGNTGLIIYRKCIQAYLADHADSLLHYDQKSKLANYFMDFYLLKEIRNILVGAAYHQKNMSKLLLSDTKLIVCHDYSVDASTIGALLEFYKKKGSINHKILLDGDLFKRDIDYSLLTFNQEQWSDLKLTVEKKYATTLAVYEQKDDLTRPIHINQLEWKRFMIDCAENGLFVKEKTLKKLINDLRTNNNLETPPPINRKVKRVPFYNWLLERD